MRKTKLNAYENRIEKYLLEGVYVSASSEELRPIVKAIVHRIVSKGKGHSLKSEGA